MTTDGASQNTNSNLYYASEFESQLQTQRSNVLISAGFALAVLAFSLLVTWYFSKGSPQPSVSLDYMKLGPLAMSGITLPVPLRMYLSYRVRRPIYVGFINIFKNAVTTGSTVGSDILEDARAALKATHKLD